MLSTFVIGLREGVEASLIVGIIAAFLGKQGRTDALRWMWSGVALATGLCLLLGIGLEIANAELPQRQQEMLETVVAAFAVGVVTYMIVWMRKNARTLKHDIEKHASAAVASGSVMTLVGMAFFAVLREGFETAVFLVAQFQTSTNTTASVAGAILGLAIAFVIGALLYRGGVKLNLVKFFRFTGVVLVLVAAGLVASAFHTAHEAGWIIGGQSQALDLSSLLKPGSVQSALAAGMFGVQPRPTATELSAWLVYVVPVMAFVLWPSKKKPVANATGESKKGALPKQDALPVSN